MTDRTAQPDQEREEERRRYDAAARAQLDAGLDETTGPLSVPPWLRAPYIEYARAVREALRPGLRVLELGAGAGRHSLMLAGNGSIATCLDIAPAALRVLELRAARAGLTIQTACAPMDATPFADSTFDLVVSAGSLSYAAPERLEAEIARILAPGGSLICVDSLNHNPIYRLNRWARWRFRRDRSRSTLSRMPTLARMRGLGGRFERSSLRGFGAWSWLWGPMARVVGPDLAARLNDACDRLPGSNRLAFKLVMQAQGLRK